MRFILNMAWRDSRASRRRLFLYSLSVVLGIAALVSIGSFSANVRQAIDLEAKGLLGADLFVTSPAPLSRPVRPSFCPGPLIHPWEPHRGRPT